MKKAIASAGLLALGAATTQTALAQSVGTSQKPWSVSGTLRGFYDDNINTSPNGLEKQSSIGYEVMPKAEVHLSSGPTTFSASYAYALTYYEARLGNKADQSHDFEVQLKHNFDQRYSMDVADSFVIAQEPDVLAPGVAVATPLRSDGSNLRNLGIIDFHGQLTRLFGFVAAYNNTLYSYHENAGNTETPSQPSRSALLDRDEHLITLDSTWLIDPRTTGIIGYRFGAIDYTSSESIDPALFAGPPIIPGPFVNSNTRDNYSHYFYVGADHNFRSDLAASGRVGVQYIEYYKQPPGNGGNSLSPYVDLSLNWAYNEGGSLTAGFTYSHSQTDQGVTPTDPTDITVDQETAVVYVDASEKLAFLSPRLTGSVTAQYQNSTFNGGVVNGESDNFYLLGLNLSYQFTHLISGEIGYNYDLLTSDIPERGYNRNRVYLGVTAAY